MRNQWKQSLIAATACAALAAGCGGGQRDADERAAEAGRAETVSLTGCIGVAPGSANEFALQQVRVAHPSGEQASDALPDTAPPPINEGSWVRLAMGDNVQQLRERVGERVTIVGTIRDDGRDRVGTSGPQPGPQQPDTRPQESQAGANAHHSEKVAQEVGPIGQQSMATGYAPLVMVQRIEGTGEQCGPTLREPENRR
jgi:hypothetical protein